MGREFVCFSDDLDFLGLFCLFLESVEESLFLSACFFLFGFAELDRFLFGWEAGDFDQDVLFVLFFYFNEALCQPLGDEFFVDLLVRVDCGLEWLFFVLSTFDFRLWISRVRDETALDVDFAISSSSSCDDTLGLKSIWLTVTEVSCSCQSSVVKASS